MAAIKLEPPGPFDIKQPEQWTRWKRRFEQYRIASGVTTFWGSLRLGTPGPHRHGRMGFPGTVNTNNTTVLHIQ